jgi:hypothetical protein
MVDIVLTLVFSVVMLLFMVFPAIKIVAWIENKVSLTERWHNPLLFGIIILLSLGIGLFLRFW